MLVLISVCLCVDVCVFTCKDGFGAAWLVKSSVGVEVNVAVSSSQSERCFKQRTSPRIHI